METTGDPLESAGKPGVALAIDEETERIAIRLAVAAALTRITGFVSQRRHDEASREAGVVRLLVESPCLPDAERRELLSHLFPSPTSADAAVPGAPTQSPPPRQKRHSHPTSLGRLLHAHFPRLGANRVFTLAAGGARGSLRPRILAGALILVLVVTGAQGLVSYLNARTFHTQCTQFLTVMEKVDGYLKEGTSATAFIALMHDDVEKASGAAMSTYVKNASITDRHVYAELARATYYMDKYMKWLIVNIPRSSDRDVFQVKFSTIGANYDPAEMELALANSLIDLASRTARSKEE